MPVNFNNSYGMTFKGKLLGIQQGKVIGQLNQSAMKHAKKQTQEIVNLPKVKPTGINMTEIIKNYRSVK